LGKGKGNRTEEQKTDKYNLFHGKRIGKNSLRFALEGKV
jgi:hypothetical protein